MKKRLLNSCCYLGLAPVFWFRVDEEKETDDLVHHTHQALGLSFLLLCCFLIFIISFALHQFILFLSRDLFHAIPLEISFIVLGLLLVVWTVFWLWGFLSAIRNKSENIPLLTKIVKNKKLLRFSVYWTLFCQLSLIILVAVAIHSVNITTSDPQQSSVMMLYDDMGYIPEWVFSFGFHQVSLAANQKWGDGSVAVIPLTEQNLETAFQNGVLIYVASHGSEGRIFLTNGTPYWPSDVRKSEIGENLQYVYLSGCDTGFLASDWERAFFPAEVKTFPRLSSMSEHIFWLLFKGPKIIVSLK